MTEHDEELHAALAVLADRRTIPGPVPVAALLHRGRRTRRRRALGASAAAVCAVALVGAAAVALAPGAAHPLPAPPVASSTSHAPAPVATPTVEAPTTGAQLLALLKTKLPATWQLSRPWQFDAPEGPGGRRLTAFYTATDGTRTGGVGIEVVRVPAPPAGGVKPVPCDIPHCTVTPQPDGSYLTVYLPAAAAGGEQDWRATLLRPDGTMVTASAGNIPGPGDPRRTPYPNAPLLDGTQLTALALDPVWHGR